MAVVIERVVYWRGQIKFGENRPARMSPPEKYFSKNVRSFLIIV